MATKRPVLSEDQAFQEGKLEPWKRVSFRHSKKHTRARRNAGAVAEHRIVDRAAGRNFNGGNGATHRSVNGARNGDGACPRAVSRRPTCPCDKHDGIGGTSEVRAVTQSGENRFGGCVRIIGMNGDVVTEALPYKQQDSVFDVKMRLRNIVNMSPYRQQLVHNIGSRRKVDRAETVDVSSAPTLLVNTELFCLECGVSNGDTLTLIRSARPLALTCAFDRSLRLWDVSSSSTSDADPTDSAACLEAIIDPEYAPVAADADLDKMQALVAFNGGWLRLIGLTSGGCLRVLGKHGNAIGALVVDWKCGRALTGSYDGSLRLWRFSIKPRRPWLWEAAGHTQEVMALNADWSSMRAASASQSGFIRFWDLRSGTCVCVLGAHEEPALALDVDWAMCVAPDASDLSAADACGSSVPNGPLRAVSGSGGDGSGKLKVWEVSQGFRNARVLRTLHHPGGVWSVACHWASDRLVCGCGDKLVRLWQISGDAKVPLRVFSGHGGIVWSVAVAWDDALVFSVSHDRTLKAWSLDDGRCEATGNVGGSGRFVTIV